MKLDNGKLLICLLSVGLLTLLSVLMWPGSDTSAGQDVSNDPQETRRVISKQAAPAQNDEIDTRVLSRDTGPAQEDESSRGIESRELEPSPELPIAPERLRSIAEHTSLQLLDHESLTVSRATIDLLGLNPKQIEELNVLLAKFVASLKSEEVAHAHVAATGQGDEVIIVAPFDRSSLIKKLTAEVAAKLGKVAADFVGEQIVYDHTINVNNFEMRLSIERDEDGLDHVVFSQEVLRRDASDFSPTFNMKIKTSLGDGVGHRYEHLFSASGSLPRRK